MADSNSTEKYQDLNTRLLGTFTPFDYEQAGMLINGPDLGDDKLSALIKHLFLQRLPQKSGLSSSRSARVT